jgi:glycine cleavage system H protein
MKYTESHEWIDVQLDGTAIVGVTDHAQSELGDIVYIELPEVGREVKAGDETAVLESTKAAADVYAPVSGQIIQSNQSVASATEMVNQFPEKEGWLFKIKLTNPTELDRLLTEEAYKKMIEGQE